MCATYNAKNKQNAKKKAEMLRSRGLNSSIYKKKKGWGISSTRK